jgi:hypothetical protein
MQLIKKSEYARRHNVSRAAVGKWALQGRIVLVNDLVDVEASDALLARMRNPATEIRAQMRANAAAGVVSMTPQNLAEKIAALDWSVDHDWSEFGVDARARQAAKCIGWGAVTSELRDDGHYGGYQLREAGKEGRASVIDGFGFELSASEVVLLCRKEIEPEEGDGDFKMEVQADLLRALALPHWQGQSKTNSVKS